MGPNHLGLAPGDLIAIKFRGAIGDGDRPADRWIRALVVRCDQDAWPLARLADGQLTEIRPYMIWSAERVGRREPPDQMAA